jgi:hypothetical protein
VAVICILEIQKLYVVIVVDHVVLRIVAVAGIIVYVGMCIGIVNRTD